MSDLSKLKQHWQSLSADGDQFTHVMAEEVRGLFARIAELEAERDDIAARAAAAGVRHQQAIERFEAALKTIAITNPDAPTANTIARTALQPQDTTR